MDVIYVFQLLISLQFNGISFSSHIINFCACYFCVLGIMEVVVVVSYILVVGLVTTTFNDISAISWWWVLLLEESWVPGENHIPVACHWQILPYNGVWCAPLYERSWNSQLLWWYALVVVSPSTMRSWPRRPLLAIL